MKKTIITLSILALIVCSCKPKPSPTSPQSPSQADTLNIQQEFIKEETQEEIDNEETPIKYSFKDISEITAENVYSHWVYLKDSISSLSLVFGQGVIWQRDTLKVPYSSECWLTYPYKLDGNKIVVYWDTDIDTKYQFDIVKAIGKIDKKLIGKPFMILELVNDTTLKATYPMKDLIEKINRSSEDNNRIFFPDIFRIAPKNYYW
jgi:hypothetical protein